MAKKTTETVKISDPYLDLETLSKAVEKFKEYENVSIYLEESYYDGESSIVFIGDREENSEERKKRLAAAKKEKLRKLEAKVKKETEEKEQLATLLLKYHGVLPEELNDWPT